MSCHILYNKNKFYRKCSYRKIQRGEFDTVAKCGEFAVIEFAVIEKALPSDIFPPHAIPPMGGEDSPPM